MSNLRATEKVLAGPDMKATPVLWCDLDGTIRKGKDELGRFVNGPEDVVLFPDIPAILDAYRRAGWRIVAVSNQGGIAMGLVTLEKVTAAMVRTYDLCGKRFDKMAWCSHFPDAPDPMMATCWCRKPRIGMLIESALELSEQHREYYPPHLGLFVGDRQEDRDCAANAGLRFMDAAEWRNGGWKEVLNA